jgi:hypothetical protein
MITIETTIWDRHQNMGPERFVKLKTVNDNGMPSEDKVSLEVGDEMYTFYIADLAECLKRVAGKRQI